MQGSSIFTGETQQSLDALILLIQGHRGVADTLDRDRIHNFDSRSP